MNIKNNKKVKLIIYCFLIIIILMLIVLFLQKQKVTKNNVIAKSEYDIILNNDEIISLNNVISSNPNLPVVRCRNDTNKMG